MSGEKGAYKSMATNLLRRNHLPAGLRSSKKDSAEGRFRVPLATRVDQGGPSSRVAPNEEGKRGWGGEEKRPLGDWGI